DDNTLFRHPEILKLRDTKEEEPHELEASKYGLSYVGLSGNIGCLVNGAGLAMATMDIIKLHGGQPLNFLDVGGGANKDQVKNALRIITSEPGLRAIFVNIFGGIMRCDIIAEAIADSAVELGEKLAIPLVVRLEGTNVEAGRKILSEAQVNIVSVNSMAEGAETVVRLAAH
ncbi:MAG: succinate--CoA ligase subunit beta, partial [Proteobacteria bacterium]|nr:succinate--CoA ligase subunit beta [Pseudomonadota bacterium]